MNIAIIDADLIGRKKHRFPNLACMKLSAYYKYQGNHVVLKQNYGNLDCYDKVFISKVFSDTEVPQEVLSLSHVSYGGTGFFYDEAPPLLDEIEHIKPDYHLYDLWVEKQINIFIKQKKEELGKEPTIKQIEKIKNKFTYYTDYSIGYTTRGCIRGCSFCVNKNYKECKLHSPVNEFIDKNKPYICLLDDNVFACNEWKTIFNELQQTSKPFQFKQGLDERLLTDEKIHTLMSSNYNGDFIFAFDNIEDRELIESKLKRLYQLYPTCKKRMKFYVLCGYDKNNKYDETFWKQDIINTFERIFILSKYSALPYIMRYEKCYTSKWSGIYTNLASWCNQPSVFKKLSFEMFSKGRGMTNENYKIYKQDFKSYLLDIGVKGSSWRYYEELDSVYPDIIFKYGHIVPDSLLEYGYGKKVSIIDRMIS